VLARDYADLAATHAFIRSAISLPLLQGHRSSLHFGWYSFPEDRRPGWFGEIVRLFIRPKTVAYPRGGGNRTHDY